jgi:hypothetical protein
MKTRAEIQAEAVRIEALGREYRAAQARAPEGQAPEPILLRYPDSRVTVAQADRPEDQRVFLRRRHLQVAGGAKVTMYALVEIESELDGLGRELREAKPSMITTDRTPFRLLCAGYELAEEDRLADQLLPYVDRVDEIDDDESLQEKWAAEVESIVEAGQLSPSARLRTHVDIVQFLEGRLEAGEFITRTIARHWQHSAEHLVQRPASQRLAIEEP